jgi:hypothetical protein
MSLPSTAAAVPQYVSGGAAFAKVAAARLSADDACRIETVSMMVAVPIAETVKVKRMTEFAADVAHLADQRPDLDLRVLVDDLHADLLALKGDEDG